MLGSDTRPKKAPKAGNGVRVENGPKRRNGSGTSVNPFELGDVFGTFRIYDGIRLRVQCPILAPASCIVCCLFVIFAAVTLVRQKTQLLGANVSITLASGRKSLLICPCGRGMRMAMFVGFGGDLPSREKGIERGLRRIGDWSVIIFTVQLAVPWRLSRLESLWCESTMTPSVGIVSDL